MESRGVKGFKQTHYKLQHTLSEWNCDLEPHTVHCPWGPEIADKVKRQFIQLTAINEWQHDTLYCYSVPDYRNRKPRT